MIPKTVEPGLASQVPGLPDFYNLASLDVTESTNMDARNLATDNAPEGTLVWAKSQGAGRGRRGRNWASPPGNMYASLILRPDCAPSTAAQISFVAALAIRDAIAQFLPDDKVAQLKWPNDVLVNQKKIAGILLESHLAGGDELDWLVVGTGVNIESYPDQVERPATSLHELGSDVSVPGYLEAYATHMLSWYRQWQEDGFSIIRQNWLEHAWGQGGPVEVRLGKETFQGVFDDLDETGALVVSTPGGSRLVSAGDVFPLTEGAS
jgi:BirA family transcriptional regulator, biotin operon repressor / biotin---[acetyl-CoA-carboxylase] ligase